MSHSYYQIPRVKPITPTEKLKVITLPSNLPRQDRISILAVLVSTFHRPPATQLHMVEAMFNLLMVAAPEMRKMISSTMTSVVYIEIEATREQALAWAGVDGGDLAAEDKNRFPVLLASPKAGEALSVTGEASVYVTVASLVFCLGRKSSETAGAADNCPDAWIKKFDIPEADQILLPGKSAGPTREVMETIYKAFSVYTEIRALIVRFLLEVRREKFQLPLREVFMTNFAQMKGAGMKHVEQVLELCACIPGRCVYLSCDPIIKNLRRIWMPLKSLRKKSVNTTGFWFLQATSDLIAEGEPTFGEYVRNKSNYANLISKVRARAPAYQSTAGASNLAALLGVKEEPLPAPFSKKTPATGRETVWREGGTGIVKNEERGELPKRLERREGGDVYYDSGDEVGSAGITRMQSGGSRGVKSTSSEIQELRLYCEEQFQTWNAVIASMQARLEHLEARMSSS